MHEDAPVVLVGRHVTSAYRICITLAVNILGPNRGVWPGVLAPYPGCKFPGTWLVERHPRIDGISVSISPSRAFVPRIPALEVPGERSLSESRTYDAETDRADARHQYCNVLANFEFHSFPLRRSAPLGRTMSTPSHSPAVAALVT